jgi:NAD(P)-dependent dehydrogenase (short-subunit alcohol dehydrogenase family)
MHGGSKVVFLLAQRGRRARRVEAEVGTARGPGQALFVRADMSKVDDIKKVDRLHRPEVRAHRLSHQQRRLAPAAQDHRRLLGRGLPSLLELNLVSYFAACKFALPHLRKVKGNIINMSSLVGIMGQSGATTYVATKGGITSSARRWRWTRRPSRCA